MQTEILTIVLGGIVGTILGLTGAGGSIIAVPLLIFGLHLTAAQAAPIALFAVAISSLAGTIIGLRQRQVRYRAASLIAGSGVILAPIGVWCASKVPNQPLIIAFACVLFYVALRLFKQPQSGAETTMSEAEPDLQLLPCQVKTNETRIHWTMQCARALAYTGAMTGFLSGLLGVGGGFIVVPALKKYTNLQMSHILPTSLSVIAIIACSSIATAIWLNTLDMHTALPFTAGAWVCMLISIKVRQRFSAYTLQRIFASFAIFVAIGLVIKVILT